VVNIEVAQRKCGEGGSSKEIGGFFILFFLFMYSLLKYKKPRGALAMA